MRAFEVRINGTRACIAGIGDDGVLTAIVSWTSRHPPNDRLEIGALNGLSKQHVDWGTFVLRTGDEVTVKLLDAEAASIDQPIDVRATT